MIALPRRPAALVHAASVGIGALVLSGPAQAAVRPEDLPGAAMSLAWALPFAGLVASVAFGPVLVPSLWHRHHGKVAAAWAAVTAFGLAIAFGRAIATRTVLAALLHDYVPFLTLLFSLYVIAGGVLVRGNLQGRPSVNLILMTVGTALASLIGTTGASMILIRPLLRANDSRRVKVHVAVFFIFLVANIGGALSPLGDPPLFVGYLRGVDFFWTTRHLAAETFVAAGLVLALFTVVDRWLWRSEGLADLQAEQASSLTRSRPSWRGGLRLHGGINFVLLGAAIGTILATSAWPSATVVPIGPVNLDLPALVREAILMALAGASLLLTRRADRRDNGFGWEPIQEVAKLFFGVFVTIAPVLAMLAAGAEGPLGPVVRLVTAPDGAPIPFAYFWLTGGLSSVLDNVPTYLVFFETAGGDAQALMGVAPGHPDLPHALAALSSGAVYMGALTYVGNAPNLMVFAIASRMGVRMPSFFGYMAWSVGVLGPVFVLASWLFFV